jgi:hypothetical protein
VNELNPELLAPGDQKSALLDPSSFKWTRIRSADCPAFEKAYSSLWAEFGEADELETREVLAARFQNRGTMSYEMLLVEKDGVVCAVRDHTAAWIDGEVVVHLSHVLVAPEQRRSGLAGWMRAAPILTGRELATANHSPAADITLVGEMEYDDGSDGKRSIRLAAYERAGYLKLDPAMVRYFQPDFRLPSIIDADGCSRPLPFQLIVRRIARESESTLTGKSVRRIIRAIYEIYGAQFRPEEMRHPLVSIDRYPADGAVVPLIPPTTPAI